VFILFGDVFVEPVVVAFYLLAVGQQLVT